MQQFREQVLTGAKVVDKLAQVFLKESGEQWILVHIENQGDEDRDFSLRMFRYTIESLTDTLPPVRVYRAGRPSAYNPFYCLSFIKRRLPLCINNTNSDNNSYIR